MGIPDLKRFRADEATVEEFILTLREEAKRKNRHLKEERESNQIEMLKRNLKIQQQQQQQQQQQPLPQENPSPKRKRQEEEQYQQQYQPAKLLQRLSTKAILDQYLEGTRRDREMRSGAAGGGLQQQPQQYASYPYPIAPPAAAATGAALSLESPNTVLPLMPPVQTYVANTITIANASSSPPNSNSQSLKAIQTIQTENDFLHRQLEQSQKMYAEALAAQQQQRSGQPQPQPQLLSTTTIQFSREASSQSLWSDWRP